jgi:hypothetical protein
MKNPIADRPFQAFVQLSRGHPSGDDGGLTVIPGFHHFAQASVFNLLSLFFFSNSYFL